MSFPRIKTKSLSRAPTSNEILARVDFFVGRHGREGGILFAAAEMAETEPTVSAQDCTLPSGTKCSVPSGDLPAAFVAFELRGDLGYPEILKAEFDAHFYSRFDITVYQGPGMPIELNSWPGVEQELKKLACWGVWELACDTAEGKTSSHFWGEMFLEKTPVLEEFLGFR